MSLRPLFLLPLLLLATPAAAEDDCSPAFPQQTGNMLLPGRICADGEDLRGCLEQLFRSYLNVLGGPGGEAPPEDRKTTPTIAASLAIALEGANPVSASILEALAGNPVPTVGLQPDPCDALQSNGDGTCGPAASFGPHTFWFLGPTLNQVLSDEQEALLGCGPFWSADCEADGIDLSTASLPALMQSWVGFDGRCARLDRAAGWHLANGEPQPGTFGFPSGLLQPLPGARSPFAADGVTSNPLYLVAHDGSIDSLVVPAAFGASAGQQFVSEMAALSFNLQLLLVALTGTQGEPELDQLDPSDPYAAYDPADPETVGALDRCSFAQPQNCRTVRAFLAPEPDATMAFVAVWTTLAALRARRPPGR